MNPYVSAYQKKSAEIRTSHRRSFLSTGVLTVLLLLALSFMLVYKHAVGQQLLIEVQELKTERQKLVTEQSVLLGQKQAGLSRSRVVEYARKELNLDFPSPDRIRWVRINESSPVPSQSTEY